MRSILFFIILIGISNVALGQKNEAENHLDTLSMQFVTVKESLLKESQALEDIKAKIVSSNTDTKVLPELTVQLTKTTNLQSKLDSVYTLAQNAMLFYETRYSLKHDDLKKHFPHEHQIATASAPKSDGMKTYLYFGEKKVIAENDPIFKDKAANDVFSEILSTDSEAYLGDFSIPQKGQKISLYDAENDNALVSNKLNFQKIRVHIAEGSVYDIQIYVTDDKNNSYLYENKIPISLLRYTTRSSRNYMFFKFATSNNPSTTLALEDNFEDYRIRLSDVLAYVPNPGDNFVPENLTLELPTKTEENANQAVTYKVRQNTSLKNIVELRTYTDFLGLFGDSPNGIVQLEGKADFYINPFNAYGAYFFKKITPFVNFSRLDEDVRYLTLELDESGASKIKNALQIVEKSYLQMGVNINVLSFKLLKEYPFSVNFYIPTRYHISDIKTAADLVIGYKSFGMGGGILLDFKRYNNFGFTYSAEFTKYNAASFNTESSIINPDRFWVFKNEAEVYYNPAENKHQAIFLRLKTFNNSTKGNNEAFYQLQFGYRFSIGVSKLKQ
jgi:hypothetical protein